MKVRQLSVVTVVLFLIVFTLAVNGSPKISPKNPVEISLNTWCPNELHPLVSAVEKPFKEGVESKSGGRIKVNVYWGNALAKERAVFDAIKAGVADISNGQTGEFPKRFPLHGLLELPLIYSSATQASLAARDLFAKYPQFSKELGDWKVLWSSSNDVHQIWNVDPEPIRTMEDMKGKVLGNFGNWAMLAEALGARSELALGASEMYQGLQKKVWDLFGSNFGPFRSSHMHEVVKSITLMGFGGQQIQYIMNRDKYESLPEDLRQVIDEVSEPLGLAQARGFDNNANGVIEWLKKEHPEITIYQLPAEERARWAEKIKFLWNDWVKEVTALGYPGQQILDDWRNFCKKYEGK